MERERKLKKGNTSREDQPREESLQNNESRRERQLHKIRIWFNWHVSLCAWRVKRREKLSGRRNYNEEIDFDRSGIEKRRK